MDGTHRDNDISHIVEADRVNVWHHLLQHKPFETGEPRIIVEGKGMRVWDNTEKSIWMLCPAAFGLSMLAMDAKALQMPCAISWLR